MKEARKQFPEGFLWGSATASYQVEGGITNNDWAAAARQGKVPKAREELDHFSRYEKDFDIAQSLAQNAHRFSVEWSRIEPEEGKFDEAAVEHYRSVLKALRARGIAPFVTLWHFTLPEWFVQKGAFLHADAPEIFARYCEYVVSKLGSEAKFWMTMNEPMVHVKAGFFDGKWPPFRKNVFLFLKVIRSMVRSHNLAFEKIKKINPELQVGIAKNNIHFASDGNFFNNFLTRISRWFWNERFLNAISNHQDFVGLNYYFHRKFGKKEVLPKSDMCWDIYPEGIFHCIAELGGYKKPVYITENGVADTADKFRADFIRDHVAQVKKAIDSGADVRGYFYWSLLDNFEWSYGFTQKFGLVEIDPNTFERKVRSSAFVYKKIIEENKNLVQ